MKAKIIKSATKNVDSINFHQMEKWDTENIWETKKPLFGLQQDDENLVVIDIKQIKDLILILQNTLHSERRINN